MRVPLISPAVMRLRQGDHRSALSVGCARVSWGLLGPATAWHVVTAVGVW